MKLPRLRQLREAALLTQAELAERAGVQRVTIGRIETGATEARISTVRKLAAALAVAPAELMATDPTPNVRSESEEGAGE